MPRRRRASTAGLVFHVLNRSAKRARLFDIDDDYRAFERVLSAAVDRSSVSLFAYCIMPNHWHLLLSPGEDGGLSRFMHWLTTTHARRWQIARGLDGQGAVYQGRFKAIPISSDQHFLRVCRYVERNALRASLVNRAEDWRWGSLWRGGEGDRSRVLTAKWPVAKPVDWIDLVNDPQTEMELKAIRDAIQSNRPIGANEWIGKIW
jgi:putative transposase